MRTMELWGVSDVGAVRKQNQDAYYVSPADARYPFAVAVSYTHLTLPTIVGV